MNLGGNSRFSMSAQNDIQRSIFDRSNSLVTSFSAAKLIPVYVDEVLPGDTVTMDMSSLVRMATPVYPVMDNAYLDLHWFFVPNRLVWDNWKYFMGESKTAWDDETDYEVPFDNVASVATDGAGYHNVYDYFGLPIEATATAGAFAIPCNALFRRAYQLTWNEWYRDQNLQDPVLIDTGDTGVSSADLDDIPSAFRVLPVNKYKDYFTSALPQPQLGESVPILSQPIPVITGVKSHALSVSGVSSDVAPLKVVGNTGTLASAGYALGVGSGGALYRTTTNAFTGNAPGFFSNLYAEPALAANTINDLRLAFATQRLLEKDARSGHRYREIVKAHFGTDVGDARVQVPEYLGGAHIPLNVMQVIQQSSTANEPSPLGETGAFSKTVHRQSMFTKSFVEHGILLGLAMVRTDHSYQQGIHRMFSRKSRLDYYWPSLANIGEQPILNKEIFANGSSADNEVFGYQEAWGEYRYRPSQITGDMRQRQGVVTTRTDLSQWHYGDFYESVPALSDEWVQETTENIARTLAVQDTDLSDQFIGQFYFKARWARPMPMYSIPGLADHF